MSNIKQNQFIKTLRFLALIAVVVCFRAAAQAQEAYAVYTTDGALTFYYDNQKSSRSGTKYALNTGENDPGWYTDHRQDIKKAVFTSSFANARPTSTYRWFALKNSYDEESNLSEVTGIQYLNTSSVTTMKYMFYCSDQLTSLDVSKFNTSNVTDMSYMFGILDLTELDVSGFKTSKVKNLSHMFYMCSDLKNIDVSHFDTSNVTDMSNMFDDCFDLTSLDVSNFNTKNVTNMSDMFVSCGIFGGLKQIDVSHFDTSNVTNMSWMFYGCRNFTNLDVRNFDTSKVTNMNLMFYGCSGLTSLDIRNFNTSKVRDMKAMFSGCSGLKELDLSNFDTNNVTSMGSDYSDFGMFNNCTNLKTIYVGNGWNTDKVTASDNMFLNCTNLVGGAGTKYDANHVDVAYAHIDGGTSNPGYLTGKNTTTQEKEAYAVRDGEKVTFYYDNQKSNRSNVREINNHYQDSYSYGYGVTTAVIDASFADYRPTSTAYWFLNCGDLTSITGMEYLNTENVTDMQYMFGTCRKLSSINVSHFNTVNVTNMGYLFFNCSSLTTLDMSNINTENVTNMIGMFSGCSSLTKLDLSNFNTKNVTVMAGMFYSCSALTTIYADKDRWSTTKITNYDDGAGMFLNCTNLVGGKGTRYDANHVNHEYAHIDGGSSNPGYLTDKNAEAEELCDADDLLRYIESLTGTTTTNDDPAEATLCDEPTIDQDVDIEDDLWLYLYGEDNATPPVMNFYGGAINLKSLNGGWTFKGVGFTNNGGTMAPQRAAGGSGGITSVGTLTFDGCTLMEGYYTVQNLSDGRMYLSGGTVVEGHGNFISSGNVYIDGSVKVADLVNKKGGRIYVTSALTKDLKVSIATAADVEQGVAIVLGGNGYTMTAADVSHITLSLPNGFEWKYNEAAGGIVVSTASGITAPHSTHPVAVDSYTIKGHKVPASHQGITIQRMSDGTVIKIYSPK